MRRARAGVREHVPKGQTLCSPHQPLGSPVILVFHYTFERLDLTRFELLAVMLIGHGGNLGLLSRGFAVTVESDMRDDLIGDVVDGHAAGRAGQPVGCASRAGV